MASPDPTNWRDAMSRPDKDKWLAAAHDEFKSLLDNGTYELVNRARTRGMKILPCHWVFRLKPDGTYKARLVVKGFMQQYGIYYTEIYAPVVRLETALLNGTIDCLIYMEQPPGSLVDPESRRNFVCKLRKSLYGLKQAPHLWYHTFVEFMLSQGFIRLHKDRRVFVKTSPDGFIIVSLYVDDLLILAPNLALIESTKASLSKRFKMKDLGDVRDILGWQVQRDRTNRTVFLHQTRSCEAILDQFSMSKCAPVKTPFESSNSPLSAAMCASTPEEVAAMANHPYRSAIGSFMYLAMGTRPDLAYPLQQLSQFLENPGPKHRSAAKHVFRYLRGSSTHGILLGGPTALSRPFLSTQITQLLFFGCLISWLAKKQNFVTLSTTEAEFVALALCIQECLYMRQLASELQQTSDRPIPVHEDNQSTIKIAETAEHYGHSKHIDVRYMFVRDLIEAQEFGLKYCPTKQQLADFFTKAHPLMRHFAKPSALLSTSTHHRDGAS
ncbi:Aste57867_16619 [Aphanomyces stellatus]|uniref:Aste57867_16619 protein n=1 Tax=Aphanomyces stellatus TaxID=120398 RepID=A0A485L5W7_9STRA|nr:hypothetical protein As57867_016562 [Aphanomyces stellatus]VFT93390.1 Aste57867_16619 [Aphanomyces stellatus]